VEELSCKFEGKRMVKQSQMYVILDALNVTDGNAQHTSILTPLLLLKSQSITPLVTGQSGRP